MTKPFFMQYRIKKHLDHIKSAHRLGTEQHNDVLIYEEKDETFSCYVYKSKSEKYIIINSSSTLSDEYRLIDAERPFSKPVLFQKKKEDLNIAYIITQRVSIFLPIRTIKIFRSNFAILTIQKKVIGKQ